MTNEVSDQNELSDQLKAYHSKIIQALKDSNLDEDIINFMLKLPEDIEDLEDDLASLVRFIEMEGL